MRFLDCSAEEAIEAGDDAVDALSTTAGTPGHRVADHRQPSQEQSCGRGRASRAIGPPSGIPSRSVLRPRAGIQGLERRAVVLVLNETEIGPRSRERLYVGLSRARDQLVVCGDPETVHLLGGEQVLAALRGSAPA